MLVNLTRESIDNYIKKANAEALWPEEDREELRRTGTSSINLCTETFWTKHIPAAENHPKFDLSQVRMQPDADGFAYRIGEMHPNLAWEMLQHQAVTAYNEGWKAANIKWDMTAENFNEIAYDCRFPEKVKDPVLDVVYELPKDWKQYWFRIGYIAAEDMQRRNP